MLKRVFFAFFVLFFIGCGNDSNENLKSGLIIPAYFYDVDLWDKIIKTENKSVVIINPSNGPGKDIDYNYNNFISGLVQTSKIPVGYVYTKWGKRDINEVKNDINKWIDLYPDIRGFFLDEANSSALGVNYYKTLYEYIKNKGDYFVVLNPGTTPNTKYFNVSDLIVVFENDVSKLNKKVCENNFKKSAAIVYGANEEEMKMYKNVCGYIYFTDDSGDNPYDTLPSYFDEEIEYLK